MEYETDESFAESDTCSVEVYNQLKALLVIDDAHPSDAVPSLDQALANETGTRAVLVKENLETWQGDVDPNLTVAQLHEDHLQDFVNWFALNLKYFNLERDLPHLKGARIDRLYFAKEGSTNRSEHARNDCCVIANFGDEKMVVAILELKKEGNDDLVQALIQAQAYAVRSLRPYQIVGKKAEQVPLSSLL